MAAPTTLFDAKDLLLKVGANTVGCETSATLRVSRESRGAAGKCSPQWIATAAAQTSWGVEFASLYLEGGNVLDSDDLAVTVGGTALEGVKGVSVEFSAETFETVSVTTGLSPSRGVDSRRVALSIDLDYYDPAGTNGAALGAVLDELLGATTTAAGLAVVVSVGGLTITGTFRPTEATIGAAKGSFADAPLTLESTGPVTYTATSADTGIAALLAAAFDEDGVQSVTAAFTTDTAEASTWSGTALPERLSVELTYPGEVTVSGTLAGVGALAPAQNPAA